MAAAEAAAAPVAGRRSRGRVVRHTVNCVRRVSLCVVVMSSEERKRTPTCMAHTAPSHAHAAQWMMKEMNSPNIYFIQHFLCFSFSTSPPLPTRVRICYVPTPPPRACCYMRHCSTLCVCECARPPPPPRSTFPLSSSFSTMSQNNKSACYTLLSGRRTHRHAQQQQ